MPASAQIDRKIIVKPDILFRLDPSHDERSPPVPMQIVIQSDLTFTLKWANVPKWLKLDFSGSFGMQSSRRANNRKRYSVDTQVTLLVDGSRTGADFKTACPKRFWKKRNANSLWKDLPNIQLVARLLACRSHGGKRVSLTTRIDSDAIKRATDTVNAWLRNITKGDSTSLGTSTPTFNVDDLKKQIGLRQLVTTPKDWEKSAYSPSDHASVERPVSVRAITSELHQHIFYRQDLRNSDTVAGEKLLQPTAPKPENMQGAVLVAGRTKSAKSIITRGIIHTLFSHKATYETMCGDSSRRPHLITCEDPVEKYFEEERAPLRTGEHRLLDYTPRDFTAEDYVDLESCFRDALRQTPACVFIGEARTDADIQAILNFAATGHLVFATMHSGSLIDVFSRIFAATDARTASARGLVAQRLLSVVHLQHLAEDPSQVDSGTEVSMVVPSLWRRTPASTAALVSGGIGSLMPNTPAPGKAQKFDCLGRLYFANLFLKNIGSGKPGDKDISGNSRNGLIAKARELDLHGT